MKKKIADSLTFILKIPVYIYRYIVSPLLKANCRYHPTCSAYMLEALDKHGPVKGLYLGLKRLSTCHGWSKKPFIDPVPPQEHNKEITNPD